MRECVRVCKDERVCEHQKGTWYMCMCEVCEDVSGRVLDNLVPRPIGG